MTTQREISNEELKRQLLSGSLGQTLKRRHLPLASNLYRSDELAKKNLTVKRTNRSESYNRTVHSIKKRWDSSPEIQAKYERIRNVIAQEIKNLREWELEMVRFGEKHPESMVINDASWHWQQDQVSIRCNQTFRTFYDFCNLYFCDILYILSPQSIS